MNRQLHLLLAPLVCLAGSAQANEPAPAKATELICSGTEPFWSAGLGPKHFEWELSGNKEVLAKASAPEVMAGVGPSYARVYRAKKAAAYVIQSQCNDGMSEKKYPYIGIVDKSGTVYQGCCAPVKHAQDKP